MKSSALVTIASRRVSKPAQKAARSGYIVPGSAPADAEEEGTDGEELFFWGPFDQKDPDLGTGTVAYCL
ncbi:MAG: hypothetical protein NTY45_03865 [Elusimicrobia bacterium]|nr:hypothetical protein [Elusimicrobiota bacterium]